MSCKRDFSTLKNLNHKGHYGLWLFIEKWTSHCNPKFNHVYGNVSDLKIALIYMGRRIEGNVIITSYLKWNAQTCHFDPITCLSKWMSHDYTICLCPIYLFQWYRLSAKLEWQWRHYYITTAQSCREEEAIFLPISLFCCRKSTQQSAYVRNIIYQPEYILTI